jgi:hypothetical protein
MGNKRMKELAGLLTEKSDWDLEDEVNQQIDRLQQCRDEDEPLKLIYGWVKQGTISLKHFKILLKKNPYKHKL